LFDRRVNIVDEGIDLAIRIGALRDSSLIVRKLGSLLSVVSGGPAYLDLRGEPRTLDDLSKIIWMCPSLKAARDRNIRTDKHDLVRPS
jgi:DNA-binding transcriptional LysR family regulator